MYNPPLFKEDRVPVLHEFIRRYPFATLVTLTADGLSANHIPMEIAPDPGSFGTLRGHVSRSNPLWRDVSAEVDALAIFSGPQAYISPSWYPTKGETGKVVPTWNYAVVHARGPLRVIEDVAWLRRLVTELTNTHEHGRAQPWAITDAPDDYISKQLGAIVGLEMPISRLEGKWKVSQNRAEDDRAGVVTGLRERADPVSQAMADLVAEADRRLRTPP